MKITQSMNTQWIVKNIVQHWIKNRYLLFERFVYYYTISFILIIRVYKLNDTTLKKLFLYSLTAHLFNSANKKLTMIRIIYFYFKLFIVIKDFFSPTRITFFFLFASCFHWSIHWVKPNNKFFYKRSSNFRFHALWDELL